MSFLNTMPRDIHQKIFNLSGFDAIRRRALAGGDRVSVNAIEKQKDRELFVEQISVGSPKEDVGPESQITPASFERILEAMLKLDGGSLPTIILQVPTNSPINNIMFGVQPQPINSLQAL